MTGTIEIKSIPWDERVDSLSEKMKSFISPELVKFKVIVKEWELWEVLGEGLRLGVFVTRKATTYDGINELVVMVTLSEHKLPLKLHHYLLPCYDEAARLRGCQAVRIHTIHKPIEDYLEKNGYRFQENIYIKRVS